jgi:hypothetical protein
LTELGQREIVVDLHCDCTGALAALWPYLVTAMKGPTTVISSFRRSNRRLQAGAIHRGDILMLSIELICFKMPESLDGTFPSVAPSHRGGPLQDYNHNVAVAIDPGSGDSHYSVAPIALETCATTTVLHMCWNSLPLRCFPRKYLTTPWLIGRTIIKHRHHFTCTYISFRRTTGQW